MLRLIKFLVMAVIAICLITIGVANMTPVDLYLLPQAMGGDALALSGVPLAAVILVSILIGVVLGEVFEWVREHKHRRSARYGAMEVAALRREIATLKRRLGEDDDLPKIAA